MRLFGPYRRARLPVVERQRLNLGRDRRDVEPRSRSSAAASASTICSWAAASATTSARRASYSRKVACIQAVARIFID